MKHFLVVDLEATCSNDGSVPRDEMETIEIGAVMCCAKTHQPIAEFQSFIRPVRNPVLTEFCLDLTNISFAQVNSAPTFPIVFAEFVNWANEFSHFTFCSWGDYDRSQLRRDCRYHQVEYPFGNAHINLKAEFAVSNNSKKKGVQGALRSVGLKFIGSHHRGIDDARNIACLLPYIFP